jgi:hypothetical protein
MIKGSELKNPIAVNFGALQASDILPLKSPLVGVTSFLKDSTKTVSTKKQLIPNEMKLVKASLDSSRGSDRGNRQMKHYKNAHRAFPPHVSYNAFGRSAPNFVKV